MTVDSCWPTTLCHLLMHIVTPPIAQRALAHCCVLSGHHGIRSNPCDRIANQHGETT
uniref:Uncharacterized protein n=1 Tax=Arundo donax TaxID=35708 RepID=A0A0A8XYG1_ARUDO